MRNISKLLILVIAIIPSNTVNLMYRLLAVFIILFIDVFLMKSKTPQPTHSKNGLKLINFPGYYRRDIVL